MSSLSRESSAVPLFQPEHRPGVRCEPIAVERICNCNRTEAGTVRHVFREDRGAPGRRGGGEQHAIPVGKAAFWSFLQRRANGVDRIAEGLKTCDQLSCAGRRIFCIELQLGGGCRVKLPDDLQRQRTIETDRSPDEARGEVTLASFAGVHSIDQNVCVERETFNAHATRRASSGAPPRSLRAWCAPI